MVINASIVCLLRGGIVKHGNTYPYGTITLGDTIAHPLWDESRTRFPPKHALRGTHWMVINASIVCLLRGGIVKHGNTYPYGTITLGDTIAHPLWDESRTRFPPKHALRGTPNENGGLGNISPRRSLVVLSTPSPLSRS